MKLDLKSIVILILTIFVIGLSTNYFLSGDNHKKEIKKLESENKKIQDEKKIIDQNIQRLQREFKIKDEEINKLIEIEKNLQIKIKQKDLEVEKAKQDLNKVNVELEKTRIKIRELEKNPVYKNGDNLLKSLREKTN